MAIPRLTLGILVLFCTNSFIDAQAQQYPTKPIRMVTSNTGGGADIITRLLADGMAGPLGKPVIVDNRPTSIVAGGIVAQAPRDGYTLVTYGDALWLGQLLRPNTLFDPVKDLAPISLADSAPMVLVVPGSFEARSIKELIDLAKAKPGALNFAAGSVGSLPFLAGELFKSMARVNIVHIPYAGTGAALTDVMGGRVQLMFATIGAVSTNIQSGKLRALAVSSSKPSALLPDVPTVSASGLPGYKMEQLHGVFARAGTPTAIINRLNEVIVAILNKPETKSKLLSIGVESAPTSPAEFGALIKSDIAKWDKVIRDGHIREKLQGDSGS